VDVTREGPRRNAEAGDYGASRSRRRHARTLPQAVESGVGHPAAVTDRRRTWDDPGLVWPHSGRRKLTHEARALVTPTDALWRPVPDRLRLFKQLGDHPQGGTLCLRLSLSGRPAISFPTRAVYKLPHRRSCLRFTEKFTERPSLPVYKLPVS